MSIKLMMIGTGVMFAGIAAMAANRLSEGKPGEALARLRCGDNYGVSVDGAAGDVVCGFNADMHWIALMAGVFVLGLIINMIGRIKAGSNLDR